MATDLPTLGKQSVVPGSSPEALRAFVASELKKWAEVVNLADIKPE